MSICTSNQSTDPATQHVWGRAVVSGRAEKRIDSQENRLESSFPSSICQLTRITESPIPDSEAALVPWWSRSRTRTFLARARERDHPSLPACLPASSDRLRRLRHSSAVKTQKAPAGPARPALIGLGGGGGEGAAVLLAVYRARAPQ